MLVMARHTPATHLPRPHTVPQAPQFLASVAASVQAPLQAMPMVPGQTHLPAVQLPPVAQALLHAPQLAASICRLRQTLAQADVPPPHTSLHVLATQERPLAQAVPHAPQLAASMVVSLQTPLQRVR